MLKVQFNQDIKSILDEYDIKQYQVAYYIGVSRFTIGRWLAKPLTKDKLKKFYEGIDKLIDDQGTQLIELNSKIEKRLIEC